MAFPVETGHVLRLDAAHEADPVDAQRPGDGLEARLLAAGSGDRQGGARVMSLEEGEGLQRVLHLVVELQVPRRHEPRQERVALGIGEARDVHHVPHHPRAMAMAREDIAQVHRGDDDLVDHPEPRVHEQAPARQVVARLAAVVVEDHALPVEAPGHDGRQRGEEERPVRGAEDVDHVGPPEAPEARQIEDLVGDGPQVGVAAEPPEARGERRVDGHEAHVVAVVTQMSEEGPGLDPLASQDVEARRHDGDRGTARRAHRVISNGLGGVIAQGFHQYGGSVSVRMPHASPPRQARNPR